MRLAGPRFLGPGAWWSSFECRICSTERSNQPGLRIATRHISKGMSEHKITLTWKRGDAPFEYQNYHRDHTWSFDGGHEMTATAAPAYLGNPKIVDPEEAFVASLSSCHMLTFLAIACKQKFVAGRIRRRSGRPHGEKRGRQTGHHAGRAASQIKLSGDKQPTRKRSIKCTTRRTKTVSSPTRSRPKSRWCISLRQNFRLSFCVNLRNLRIISDEF